MPKRPVLITIRGSIMWRLLQRHFESLWLGFAASIMLFAALTSLQVRTNSPLGADTVPMPLDPGVSQVAAAPQDFASQWRQIAEEFYALHPVMDSASAIASHTDPAHSHRLRVDQAATDLAVASRVSPAPLVPRTSLASPASPALPTSPAAPASLVSHRMNSSVTSASLDAEALPEIGSSATTPLHLPTRASLSGYALASSLAAGILTVMLYWRLWPTAVVQTQRALDGSHNLRLELPSEWVHVRPAFRQRVRPLVLLASPLGTAIASWSMLR